MHNPIVDSTFLSYLVRSNCVSLFRGCHSLGALEKVKLGSQQLAAINELIPGAAVNVQEAFQFKKINYRKQVFYSKSCMKVKKRNSYTVIFVGNDGAFRLGMIAYFLKVLLVEETAAHHLAAVEELHPCPEEGLMAGVNVSTLNKELGCYMKPYRQPRSVKLTHTCRPYCRAILLLSLPQNSNLTQLFQVFGL